jgi:hypothetical protein
MFRWMFDNERSLSLPALIGMAILTAVAPVSADDDTKAAKKKAGKKPGNEIVDKTTAKERKALAKVLEKQGGDAESVNRTLGAVTPEDRREALRTIAAIQAFVRAVEAVEKDGGDSSVVEKILSERPAKKVETPKLKSADLDALMDKALAASGVEAAPTVDDATFLRRASLDLTGMIPSPEKIAEFEKSVDPEKRSKAIRMMLDSPAFAVNLAKYWRDVIRYRATETQPRRFQPQALEEYFRDKFAANTPWDEIAKELITATGPIDENPAVLLTTAQESKAEETAGEVSRVFMGVQIQCAQCHDHPTDSWKRDQFQQFAAFFSGLRTVNFSGNQVGAAQRVFGARAVGQPIHQVANPKDPTDMQRFAPEFFLGETMPELPMNTSVEGRRKLAAAYIASQDNPWFAKAFVNRVWYALNGDAFYMPIDDIGPDREGKNLEVMDALASAWAKGGYDIKWLYETVANTKTYQRQSRSPVASAAVDDLSGANCPTRLRADQILQNLRQVTGFPIVGIKVPEIGTRRMGSAAKAKAQAKAKSAGVPPQLAGPLARAAVKANQTFSFDPSTPDDELSGTIPQALFLMNAPDLNRAVEARDGSVLRKILEENPKDDAAALTALYRRVLARVPNDDESKIALGYVKEVGDRNEAFEDLFWSLLNCAEFLSRR